MKLYIRCVLSYRRNSGAGIIRVFFLYDLEVFFGYKYFFPESVPVWEVFYVHIVSPLDLYSDQLSVIF